MPGWECGKGRVDGWGARTATDEGRPGTRRRGATFHGMRRGPRWPHTLNNPPERCPKEVALVGLAANRADFFPKISENPNLSVFAGMAQGGRYGYRRPPEMDCISAQIQQVKILCVRSAVERISRA